MEYQKPIMRFSELHEQNGFSRRYLTRAYNSPGQKFAWKHDPLKRNSPILFDTAEFEKWRQKEIDLCRADTESRRKIV